MKDSLDGRHPLLSVLLLLGVFFGAQSADNRGAAAALATFNRGAAAALATGATMLVPPTPRLVPLSGRAPAADAKRSPEAPRPPRPPRDDQPSGRTDPGASRKDGAPRISIGPYLQDVTTDGILVVWETDQPTTGVVRLEQPRSAAFLSLPGTHHEVRLSGLRPGTRYRYQVAGRASGTLDVGTEVRSEPAEFTTAPLHGPFTFLVYGDNRDRESDHIAVIRAMVPEAPDFFIQTGDMVGNAGEDVLWRRYFHAAQPLLRSAPMYPALGNHELRGDSEARHFFRYFTYPGKEPRAKVVYYRFRYSNTLFIALDGNSPADAAQAEFLADSLARSNRDTDVRHVFVYVHQPPYAVGAYCGSAREQRHFVPLFSRYPKVRAVFGGHEHAYQHLERGGVRYFVSGGGGAPLYTRSQPCREADQRALRLFKAEHHYLRVRVRGDEALLTAINRNGAVLEEVPLHVPIPTRLNEPEAPDTDEDVPPPSKAPDERWQVAALALPLALALSVAVAAAALWLLRPLLLRKRRRRRRDLLPGGEPPPRSSASSTSTSAPPRRRDEPR